MIVVSRFFSFLKICVISLLFLSTAEIYAAPPKISIIIPVYNTERFIRECIDSVLNQSFSDIEIICVDDGSSDNCPQILDEYAKKDRRVKVIHHKKNAGIAAARNTGLNAATGEYIGFVDSDDYIHPKMYEIMYSAIVKNNSDIVMCDADCPEEFEKANFEKIDDCEAKNFNKTHFMNNFCVSIHMSLCWNKLYKKDFIGNMRFDEDLFGTDDTFFNICLAPFITKYSIVCRKIYFWRQCESVSRRPLSRKRIDSFLKAIEKIHDLQNNKAAIPYSLRCEIIERLFRVLVNDVCSHWFSEEELEDYVNDQIDDLYSRKIIQINPFLFYLIKICLFTEHYMRQISKLWRKLHW